MKTACSRRLPGLLILVAVLLLGAAFAGPAAALPTFTDAVGGVGPCDSCHTQTQIHGLTQHTEAMASCSNCHKSGTATPPPTSACAPCHGGVGVVVEAHVGAPAPAAGCSTASGCHVGAISGLSPNSGPVGTTVHLTGTAFTGSTAVAFNGVSATFNVVSDTAITATVPASATTGPVTVTGARGTGTSVGNFTVTIAEKPVIVRLKPTAGKRGVAVLILGKAFGAKRGTSLVKFGKVKVAKYVLWSNGKIKVRVPNKAKFGLVKVKVTTTVGTSNAKTFRVKR
jgi:hypothetical protein